MTALDAALFVAAVLRLVRLVAVDEIPFGWLVARLTPGKFLERLISCPWCLSLWIAAGWLAVAGAARHVDALGAWRAVSLVLGASLAAGLILGPFHAWEDRHP